MLILEETQTELTVKSLYKLFQMYFDSVIMKRLTEETLRYALQKSNNVVSITEMDIQKLFRNRPVLS